MFLSDYQFVTKYHVIARPDMSEPKQSIMHLLSKKIASLLRKTLSSVRNDEIKTQSSLYLSGYEKFISKEPDII
jgi:hypothetical protein